MLLEKTLESSLDFKEINQSILNEINPEYPVEGLMPKLKLQYFGHLIQRADSLEKTPMLGNIENRRRRGQQRTRLLDSIPNSMDIYSSKFREIMEYRGSWPAAVLGSQRVKHDLVIEQVYNVGG